MRKNYYKRNARYWRKIEWKFRLRRALERPKFELSFKHVPFLGLIFDNESLIRNIADHYGYYITNKTLSIRENRYEFTAKKCLA